MTAKMDLLAKLTALMPECAGEIAKILHDYEIMPDRKSTRLNSSHITRSRMPSSA